MHIVLLDKRPAADSDLGDALSSALGASILHFQDVAQAKASAEASEVDAVVVRCSAQTTDPGALIGEIRSLWSEVPVIVASGPGADQNGISAASLGVDAWIVEDKRCGLRVAAALTRAVEQNLRHRQLQALNAIASQADGSLDLVRFLDGALDHVLRALRVEICGIFLFEGNPPLLRLRACRGLSDDLIRAQPELRVGRGFSVSIAACDEPLLVNDTAPNTGLLSQSVAQAGFHFFAGVPLHAGQRITGTLWVLSRSRPTHFDLTPFLATVGNQVGAAIENARLYHVAETARSEWETTFNAMDEGICLVGNDHRIMRANPAFVRLMEHHGDTVIGGKCHALVHGLEAPPEGCVRQCLLRGQRPEPMEIHLAGNGRQFVCSAYPKRDADGRLDGVVHVFRDVTEVRRLHDQVAQTDKLTAVGELLAGVAHELNNPLTTVGGLADLLQRNAHALPSEVRDDLSAIAQEAARATRIVHNLLAFSRQTPVAVEPVDLRDCLRRALEMFDYQFRVDNIRVETDLPADLPWVSGECNRLEQVLVNLFSNARHALAEVGGGVLSVRAASEEETVRLEIADTGPGIPEEHLDHVFDPFFTTKAVGNGTGLGLSICRGIISKHGGGIEIANRPDGGVLAVVTLPRAAQPHAAAAPAPAEAVAALQDPEWGLQGPRGAGRTSPVRVLVVDDEPFIQRFVLRTLETAGHDAAAAGNAEEALDLLRRRRFDVVLCDLKMPGAGGQGLYRTLLSEHAELAGHIIFCTGDTARPATQAFLNGSGAQCLLKPFTAQQLLDAIRNGTEPPREIGKDPSA